MYQNVSKGMRIFMEKQRRDEFMNFKRKRTNKGNFSKMTHHF